MTTMPSAAWVAVLGQREEADDLGLFAAHDVALGAQAREHVDGARRVGDFEMSEDGFAAFEVEGDGGVGEFAPSVGGGGHAGDDEGGAIERLARLGGGGRRFARFAMARKAWSRASGEGLGPRAPAMAVQPRSSSTDARTRGSWVSLRRKRKRVLPQSQLINRLIAVSPLLGLPCRSGGILSEGGGGFHEKGGGARRIAEFLTLRCYATKRSRVGGLCPPNLPPRSMLPGP